MNQHGKVVGRKAESDQKDVEKLLQLRVSYSSIINKNILVQL